MQDTFQWTTELVNEYAGTFLLQAMKAIEAARNGSTVEKIISASEFIASKAPKKEWEIVAYSFEPLKGIDKPVLVTQGSKYWESAISGDKDFLIHSVRRLSDASEWHVKEKVDVWETGSFTIQSFEISAGQMLVKTDGGTYLLNALIKLPQPILTTVDGVEIRENEECWIVDKHYNLLPEPEKINEFKRNYFSNCFIFSTREVAEKYILDHAPKLSLNDVKETASATVKNYWLLMEALSIKVKQKLNQ